MQIAPPSKISKQMNMDLLPQIWIFFQKLAAVIFLKGEGGPGLSGNS